MEAADLTYSQVPLRRHVKRGFCEGGTTSVSEGKPISSLLPIAVHGTEGRPAGPAGPASGSFCFFFGSTRGPICSD